VSLSASKVVSRTLPALLARRFSTVVTFAPGELPANYVPVVNPGQTNVTWYVSAKTGSGFTVNLVPLSTSIAVAAGTFDVVVFGYF
jgi:hypothetical protein